MFGSHVALRNKSKLTPFAYALFGGNNVNISGHGSASGISVSASTSNNGFSMALGGGMDVSVSRALAIRLVQADYLRTSAFSNSLNKFALAFGVDLRLGSRSGGKK
jgi:opacity protein-like surface antigen